VPPRHVDTVVVGDRRPTDYPRDLRVVALATSSRASERDGKEGVDGSSPSEGFAKPPQMSGFLRLSVVRVGDVRSHEVARLSLQQRFARDPLFTNEGIE
jgi:hypothetical protein